jgi:hypothetical protein
MPRDNVLIKMQMQSRARPITPSASVAAHNSPRVTKIHKKFPSCYIAQCVRLKSNKNRCDAQCHYSHPLSVAHAVLDLICVLENCRGVIIIICYYHWRARKRWADAEDLDTPSLMGQCRDFVFSSCSQIFLLDNARR